MTKLIYAAGGSYSSGYWASSDRKLLEALERQLIVANQLEPVMSASVTATSRNLLNVGAAGTPMRRHHLDQRSGLALASYLEVTGSYPVKLTS